MIYVTLWILGFQKILIIHRFKAFKTGATTEKINLIFCHLERG
jgi:hypothetical protein